MIAVAAAGRHVAPSLNCLVAVPVTMPNREKLRAGLLKFGKKDIVKAVKMVLEPEEMQILEAQLREQGEKPGGGSAKF